MTAELANAAAADNSTLPTITSPAVRPRLWPGVILAAVYWLACSVVYLFFKGTFTQFLTLFWTPFLVAAGTIAWILFFSRLPWVNRFWILGCLLAGGLLAGFAYHKSMMFGLFMSAMPMAITAVVLWLIITRGARSGLGGGGVL